jgi:radical SAM superfamily enzyme YgiQ (UPF0313 family)
MADFVDLFVLGEAEEAVVELAKLVMESKKAGRSKADTLRTAVERYDWAYVPALYGQPGMRSHFHSAVVSDFDNAPVPTKPIIPFVQAVHERVSVEIMRGCPGRCRFCQASFCRRPIRYRSIDRIVEIAKAQYQSTGFDTVSLLSLSTGDYPKLDELVAKLNEYFSPLHVGISLPSLRVDEQLALLPTLGASVRKSGLTIAVEAASMRLRQAINKPLTDENLIAGVEAAYRAGYRSVKLYFMTGFPGETQDDIRAIFDLCVHLATIRKAIDGRMGAVTAAVSWLVPKAHTPFGFLAQKPRDYFENARRIILDEKRRARIKYVDFKFHDINRSILESAIGRGGRELGSVIETAYRSGARFDLWDECFDNQRWLDAFASHNLDLESLAQRQFTPDETPPWQHLGGPRPEVLWDHFNAALETL